MRLFVALTVVALLAIAVADAVVRENGPIFFFGSRAPDFHSEIYSVRADGTGRANLTRHPAADGGPEVSPDGRRIAFVSRRDGYDAVYVMNPDGNGSGRLVGRIPSTSRIGPLIWSPTGRPLAFMATQPQPGSFFDSRMLYVVDPTNGRLRLIGGMGCGGEAAFSADGRFVAHGLMYCRGAEVVRVARTDGGAERTVGTGSFVGWSPRGQRLLHLRRSRNRRIEVATVDPSGRGRWVLRGIPASAAAWSPTGRLIAFSRSAGRRPGIYVVQPGGRRPRRLVGLAKASSIAWSPNGAWLALSTARTTREGGVTIHVVRSNGKGLRRVADARTLPVWSRNSRHLAFVGLDGGVRVVSPPDTSARRLTDPAADAVEGLEWGTGDRLLFPASGRSARSTQVLAVEPDGSGLRQVTRDGAPVGRISPDGLRVAFVRDADIWTAHLDGSDQRQLTSDAALEGGPAWSPDGERIAFARATGSASDIFIVASGGGAVRQLTYQSPTDHAGAPAWSPDGNWIAFISLNGLSAVHPDGSARHRISTVGQRAYGEPAWSPDGTRIALGGCAIAVVNADGSGFRELTGSGVREGQPTWSPDGTKIVFTRSATPCPSDLTGDSDLWTINPEGTGETRLTDGPWPDTLPSWQPVRP